MTESPYEDILLEMQTLSQRYALGKLTRRHLEKDLQGLRENLSSQVMAERILKEKRRAFNQGFFAAFFVALALWSAVKVFIHLFPYWG
ncbi:MAG TPA: hypothetical protein VHE12_11020 [bacterium]|nr:hypothetical protein [bacterium]